MLSSQSHFTLFDGNRTIARSMFVEDLLALKNRYMDRFAVHFLMSREPQQTPLLDGRLDGDKVRELARALFDPAAVDEYFICGPGGMVDSVRDELKAFGGDTVIRVERFTTAGQAPAPQRLHAARWQRLAGPGARPRPPASRSPPPTPDPAR